MKTGSAIMLESTLINFPFDRVGHKYKKNIFKYKINTKMAKVRSLPGQLVIKIIIIIRICLLEISVFKQTKH